MPDVESFEVLIIGGGKAGKTLAADLGRAGHHVALVERGMIGGTCINVGCIPSKAFVKCARTAESVARASVFGVEGEKWKTEMTRVAARKRDVVAGMVNVNWNNLHNSLGDHFILGEARFLSPRTVEVTPNDGGPVRHIRGEKLFINLGAAPSMPSIPGLVESKPLTSDSALALERLPAHLVIIGGGYIGVEMGQVYRRFGSRVTIIQHNTRLLPNEDVDVSEAIEKILREDGIDLLFNCDVSNIEGKSSAQIKVILKSCTNGGPGSLEASDLLIATGRTPLTRGVGLDLAGVDLNSSGFIVVNDRLETSAPNTWALGDCAGSRQQTHVALDDYRIVKANVFAGGKRSKNDRLIPHTVFLDPELGRVGLTEREARKLRLPIKVATVPISIVPRARILGETRGFLKAVIHADSNQIIGFSMLGTESGEVTAIVQIAMLGKLPYTALRDGILAHPTMAEGLNYLFAAAFK